MNIELESGKEYVFVLKDKKPPTREEIEFETEKINSVIHTFFMVFLFVASATLIQISLPMIKIIFDILLTMLGLI